MKKIFSIFCVISLIILTTIICNPISVKASSISTETKWEVVNSSLSDLLNNGWKVINHSYADARTSSSPGIQGTVERTFTYLLLKNGKYITCSLPNPYPGERNVSGCRLIN
jgi:hypothetical protein